MSRRTGSCLEPVAAPHPTNLSPNPRPVLPNPLPTAPDSCCLQVCTDLHADSAALLPEDMLPIYPPVAARQHSSEFRDHHADGGQKERPRKSSLVCSLPHAPSLKPPQFSRQDVARSWPGWLLSLLGVDVGCPGPILACAVASICPELIWNGYKNPKREYAKVLYSRRCCLGCGPHRLCRFWP